MQKAQVESSLHLISVVKVISAQTFFLSVTLFIMGFVLQDGRVCRLAFSINPDKIESGKPEPRDKR